MASPKISIIVPVYNAENYLHRCVDSLLAQTFLDFEILLVDDGSPDESGKICDEYAQKDERVLVFHKENGGVSSARQCGLDHAQGEYVIHVDPDDWVESDYLEKLYAKALSDCADIVICDFSRVYSDHIKIEKVKYSLTPEECIASIFRGSMHASLCNKLVRKDLYTQHHINFPYGLNLMEDLAVLFRLFYFSKRVVYVNKSLYNYNKTNSNSYTSRFLNDKYCEGYIDLDALIVSFFQSHSSSNDVLCAVRQKHISLIASILFYASDNFIETHKSYLHSCTVKEVIRYSSLSLHYKAIVLLYIVHFYGLVNVIRKYFRKQKLRKTERPC